MILSIQTLSEMPCNLAGSLPINLLAWCCYIALRIVRAHPALQGSLKGHDLAPAIDSSHENFLAPHNDHHGFNHGEFVNHKRRLWESQQVAPQTEFSTIGPQLLDLDVDRDFLGKRTSLTDLINPHSMLLINWTLWHNFEDIRPENGIRSTHVAKQPKTVQDGHFATPIPQSLNHGSDTSSTFGPTTCDGSRLTKGGWSIWIMI